MEIDTTDLSIEEQVSRIVAAWARRHPEPVSFDYRLHQVVIGLFGRLCLGMRVEGAQRVPMAGGLIVAANHKSYLDPPLIGAAIPREIHYLAKRELFEMPVLKHWVRTHNAIPVRRSGFDRAALQECLRILGRGGATLVFPEGTRILRHALGEPREGAAWLAVRARVPVLPVLLRGTWAGERRWFRPGGLRIRIGDPFLPPPAPPGPRDRGHLARVAEGILHRIAALETNTDSA
ncbi:MAG: 1-acyl-sn-glycerol-3-phosphate acyltransferase [Candidatus Latescibacteria bacterium]|nr:1-acyl-sn-glycerol-3-phosphate acyltransferase [Candidatus Latescibacterota bacterium]